MNRLKFIAISIMAGSVAFSSDGWSKTLDQVVKYALNNHPEALIAISKIRAEQEKVDIAWAEYLPTLDISVGAGGQKRKLPDEQRTGTNNTHDKSYTRKEGSIALKQNLFSGFDTKKSVAQARFLTRAKSYQLGSTLEDLALKVTNAYLKVLESKELVELSEENLKLHDKMYQQIQKRVKQGLARSSDLAQIQGRRARANANLINAKNNLEDARSEYHSLVGKMPPKTLGSPPVADLVLPESFDEALILSLQMHPGIQAADHEIKAAEAAYQSQKSRYFPSLDLEIDQNWRTNADGSLGTTESLSAMARLTYNVFRGGADKALMQQQAYQMEEARAQKDRLLRKVEEKLRQAWDSYDYLSDQLDYLRLHEKASKKTLQAYQEQFYIGKRTLLDLLDTENELFQSSQTLTRTSYQEAYSRYRVLAATGQLLTIFNLTWADEWLAESD